MRSEGRRVAVLGATGSIGTSTLEVIRCAEDRMQAVALSAHRSIEHVCQLAQKYRPRWLVLTDPSACSYPGLQDLPSQIEILSGAEGLNQIATSDEVDVVVAAIVGSAGLESTWESLSAGKTVALANKETLVVAGKLMTDLAKERKAPILPVDSEHSAIFQALQAGKDREVRRIILTASGGPFLRHTRDQLRQVSVEEALDHPTWKMGPKITVDSATLMNKALEMIEARWLFDLRPEQIEVVIHPQSVIHSMVEYVDGSVVAQLSPPDMKLPIQYALDYPNRQAGNAAKMDWKAVWDLHFEPPDLGRFPALELGWEVAKQGGTTGAVVNAANEAAVARFLNKEIAFHEIVPACRRALKYHHFDPSPTLDVLRSVDRWARKEVTQWASS
ncbi:1-deoxy-D-xylulose 5-phosphate reductoisomerase [Planctomycetales bacterium 10988]|nr:1-deoxy-D-xylulose 5-phosphate reductoisomerase [Planctomycetales bacterium 10988]